MHHAKVLAGHMPENANCFLFVFFSSVVFEPESGLFYEKALISK
jgi:hypothetical protein